MRQLDLVQLAASNASSKDDNRRAIDGIIISEGAAIATDGHMLVRIEDSPHDGPAPDAQKVLDDAIRESTHFEVFVDPAKLAHLLQTLMAAAGVAKAKKRAPTESVMYLRIRTTADKHKALVFDVKLPDERWAQALLMPLRAPDQFR